jgi:hypothetical protein
MLRHDSLSCHDADALINHALHVYVRFCERTVLKTEMAVVIDPRSIGRGSEIFWFLKGHTAALTELTFGLLALHDAPPFSSFIGRTCLLSSLSGYFYRIKNGQRCQSLYVE